MPAVSQTKRAATVGRESESVAFLEISVTPVGTESASISSIVSEACEVAEAAGVKHQVTATGTVLEGDLERLLTVAQRMHAAAFRSDVHRVVTNIHIDDRRDKAMAMESAVAAVQQP